MFGVVYSRRHSILGLVCRGGDFLSGRHLISGEIASYSFGIRRRLVAGFTRLIDRAVDRILDRFFDFVRVCHVPDVPGHLRPYAEGSLERLVREACVA